MGRIEISRPQVDASKITITQTVTVQIEPPGSPEERRESVAVQETEPPTEPTDSRVIIYWNADVTEKDKILYWMKTLTECLRNHKLSAKEIMMKSLTECSRNPLITLIRL